MCTRSSYYDIYMILHGTGTDTRPTWSITYGTVQHIYTRLQIGNLYSVETEVLKTDSFVTGILQPNIVQVATRHHGTKAVCDSTSSGRFIMLQR